MNSFRATKCHIKATECQKPCPSDYFLDEALSICLSSVVCHIKVTECKEPCPPDYFLQEALSVCLFLRRNPVHIATWTHSQCVPTVSRYTPAFPSTTTAFVCQYLPLAARPGTNKKSPSTNPSIKYTQVPYTSSCYLPQCMCQVYSYLSHT